MRYKLLFGILLLVGLSNITLIAQDARKETAEDSLQYNWERFSVNLGGFLASMNSDISLRGRQMGLGVIINMEDALGLSSSAVVIRGEAEYNFGSKRRSHVKVSYFGIIRNSTKTLKSELEIGNSVFPVGTELASRLGLHIIRGLYDYSYFRDDRISLGISGGLYVLPMNFSIRTDIIIDESASFIAPLPVFGIRNDFLITPKISLKQNLEVLYLKTSGSEGSISDLNIWIEFNPFKHFGFGLGYNTFQFNFSNIEGTRNEREFEGSFKTGYSGLLFYGRYFF